ncbi:alpha/beta-hydrolase [Aspergillus sclerotioniger CBS 115572]|uniref:Alpha/beta-hydrolase n=1 Tax=Aspergillus sclerotioniger CBS 115572 TaxID=1450535 RepID=A0A317WS84_9EURO|nr:alpha/beta-hydrolase [Aspergillus sclerotioniger CBS 115572]PWY88895.1 alpha/beta-hydrolase [Aspergillus sclerotioniger CBS 115572]
MHCSLWLALTFSLGAFARPRGVSPGCAEVAIPIPVAVPRYIINATVQTDWDAVALTLNLTRRDSGTVTDPLPVAGSTTAAVANNFTVAATLCQGPPGAPVLVLTHGIIESKLYWRPNFTDADAYSFVDAALKAGYSVLSYDRIGVGASSKVNSLFDAQFQVETAVLNSLTEYARQATKASRVALVGHSYGAYLTAASASQMAVDAVVLTGFSGTFTYFGPFLAGAGLRVARHHNPARWGMLDSGYLTSSDLFAETYVYFAEPYFEHRVAEWAFTTESEPFAVGELPSLLETTIEYGNITAPVLVLQGQFDVSACGGNCVGLLNSTKALFTAAKTVETVDNLPAGHNLNLHKVAPQAFDRIFRFLRAQGV